MSVPQHLASYIQDWKRIHQQTVNLIKTVPDDQYEWRTCPSAMTLGELANHLQQAETGLVHAAINGKFPDAWPAPAANTADLLKVFEEGHEAAVAQVSALTPEQLEETITPFGPDKPMTRVQLLRALHEHEIHHRAQLYTYLRILDVAVPPLFG